MTIRAGPLVGGLAALAAGVGLIALFSPQNRYISYAQVTTGSIAIIGGLYLLLVVSWRELGDTDPRKPRLYSLVRREARGRLLRTVASGGALAVLVGILLSTMFITSGAASAVSSTKDKLGADMLVVPRDTTLSAQPFYTLSYAAGVGGGSGVQKFSIPPYLDASVTRQVSAVPGVKQATPQLLVSYFLPSGGCGGLDATYIVAVEPQNNFILESWLPGNVSASLAGNGAIAGAEVPDFYQLPAAAYFYGVQLVREAILPRTGTFMDHVIFVSVDTANAMLKWQQGGGDMSYYSLPTLSFSQGQVSAIFVKVQAGVNPITEAAAVSSQVAGAKAYTLDSLAKAATLQFSGLLSIFTFSGALVWVGSVALVATVASLATNERRGEIGVMRTLGASKRFVSRLVASQTMFTTSVAGLIGILAVWVTFNSPVAYDSVILSFKMPYVPPSPTVGAYYVAIAVAVVVLTSGVGALLASRVSGRIETYDAIRQGAR